MEKEVSKEQNQDQDDRRKCPNVDSSQYRKTFQRSEGDYAFGEKNLPDFDRRKT